MPTVYITAPPAAADEIATDLIEKLHPYDVPCIERFDEDDVFPPFADWRTEATQ